MVRDVAMVHDVFFSPFLRSFNFIKRDCVHIYNILKNVKGYCFYSLTY